MNPKEKPQENEDELIRRTILQLLRNQKILEAKIYEIGEKIKRPILLEIVELPKPITNEEIMDFHHYLKTIKDFSELKEE